MKHHALQMYDYHVWANKRVVEYLKKLPQDIYDTKIQSVFPSISEALLHIYMMDAMWLGVMSGDSFSESRMLLNQLSENVKGKSIEEMETMFFNLSKQYKTFFDRQENPDQAFSIEHPQFGRLETRLSELIQHVVNHGTHHRGHIMAMLRQLGQPGVPTDYIFYLYTLSTRG